MADVMNRIRACAAIEVQSTVSAAKQRLLREHRAAIAAALKAAREAATGRSER